MESPESAAKTLLEDRIDRREQGLIRIEVAGEELSKLADNGRIRRNVFASRIQERRNFGTRLGATCTNDIGTRLLDHRTPDIILGRTFHRRAPRAGVDAIAALDAVSKKIRLTR